MAFDNPSLFEVLASIRLKVLRLLAIFSQQFSDLTASVIFLAVFVVVDAFILITSLCCLRVL